jgi:adenosylcobinamide-GDP ribazoletransferase
MPVSAAAAAGAEPRWREAVRPPLAAVMFLTRIPCPAWTEFAPELLARSTPYFPVVGAVVGALGAAVFWAASAFWPAWVAAALSTIATVVATGAFHEDALADAADGLGGGWSPEQVLTIMKDSRIGSYGAVTLVLATGLKLGALAAFTPEGAARALIAAHVLGRWSSLPLIWRLPYVREGAAKGKPFAGGVTTGRMIAGSLIAAAIVAAAIGVRALPVAVVAVLVTVCAGRWFRHRIGGITGDCLGAANQVVEIATYLVLCARWPA